MTSPWPALLTFRWVPLLPPVARCVTLQRILNATLLCSYLVGVVGSGLLGRLLALVVGEYAAQQTALMTAGLGIVLPNGHYHFTTLPPEALTYMLECLSL